MVEKNMTNSLKDVLTAQITKAWRFSYFFDRFQVNHSREMDNVKVHMTDC